MLIPNNSARRKM